MEVDLHPLKPRDQVDTFSAAAASSYSAQLQMQQTQQLAQAQLQQFQNQAAAATWRSTAAADDVNHSTDQEQERLGRS